MSLVRQFDAGAAKKFTFSSTSTVTSITVGSGAAVTDANLQVANAGNYWQVTVKNTAAAAKTISIYGMTVGSIQTYLDPAGSTIAQAIPAGAAVNYLFSFYGPAIVLEVAAIPGVGDTLVFEVKCLASIEDPYATVAPTSYAVP